tara:strand:+ start:467 stop:1600 length:1134 start_codon:yes stop_codon:yes gene_type:complete
MTKNTFLILLLVPIFTISQVITETTAINITKSWSQQPTGYTYPFNIKVPTGDVPQGGFPVCILLHGNGGNGLNMSNQYVNILDCHVLVAPTGYLNSWNLCAENSDAPDVEMIEDLVTLLQSYNNINPNQIRIIGSSNGAGLANRVFIENTNSGIDIVCAVVSQLNEPQYHLGNFYKPSASTNSSNAYCGYDIAVNPLTTRKYLSICNANDPVIPNLGGTSVVGVDFLDAKFAAYVIAINQGYTGNQLINGTAIGSPEVTEYSYLSGNVVYLEGNAGHSTNITEINYIKSFLSNCSTLGLETNHFNQMKVYPNPTNHLTIIERISSERLPYFIHNTIGQEVLSGYSTSKTLQIDLSNLPPDVYFLKIDNQTTKIIKKN